MGRFINADATEVLTATKGEVLGANLFAYCGNNVVNNADPSGYWVWIAVGAIVGGTVGYSIGRAFGLSGWNLVIATAIGTAIGAVLGWAAHGIIACSIIVFSSSGCIGGLIFFSYKIMLHFSHHGKGIHVVIQKLI